MHVRLRTLDVCDRQPPLGRRLLRGQLVDGLARRILAREVRDGTAREPRSELSDLRTTTLVTARLSLTPPAAVRALSHELVATDARRPSTSVYAVVKRLS